MTRSILKTGVLATLAIALLGGCETAQTSARKSTTPAPQTAPIQKQAATPAPAPVAAETTIPETVYEASSLDTEPVALQRARLESLAAYRTREYTEQVFVEFVVTPEGKVVNVTTSVDDPSLLFALRQTYQQWRYKPGTVDGRPVYFRMRLPVEMQS